MDEYGGAIGIVTLEDIVEQIVGEIQDEHDRTPATVERLPDGSYRVAGRTHIDELNEALDWSLPKQRLRDGGRPGPGHPAPYPPGGRGLAGPRVHHHGARGRRPPGRGGEDRAHGRAARRRRLASTPAFRRRSTMPGKMVDFQSNGGTTQGYLATPPPARGRACS